MDGSHVGSALRTAPKALLCPEELLNSPAADEFEIVDEAHAVAVSIPAVEVFKSRARKVRTLKTEPDFVVP